MDTLHQLTKAKKGNLEKNLSDQLNVSKKTIQQTPQVWRLECLNSPALI